MARKTGPRGGRTTVTESGLVRKTIWLHEDEAEELRDVAYRERLPESEVMRRALRKYLRLEE